MKFTEAGEPYYVDHVSKKTQWQHPAITAGPQVTVFWFSILTKRRIAFKYLCEAHSNWVHLSKIVKSNVCAANWKLWNASNERGHDSRQPGPRVRSVFGCISWAWSPSSNSMPGRTICIYNRLGDVLLSVVSTVVFLYSTGFWQLPFFRTRPNRSSYSSLTINGKCWKTRRELWPSPGPVWAGWGGAAPAMRTWPWPRRRRWWWGTLSMTEPRDTQTLIPS